MNRTLINQNQSSKEINPFATRVIHTPWGDLIPKVDIFPLIYVIVLYALIYFLPYGVFEFWRKGEDGPAEWLQFLGYLGAFISCLFILWRDRKQKFSRQWLFWLLLALFCFYVGGEEISWAERITNTGLEVVKKINAQGETNLHNLPAIQNYLHFSFIASGLFFGWFGWRWWPTVQALPSRQYSLYFLIVALFYTYWDLSWITLGERIRNDQEAIEFLMAVGLFRHCLQNALQKMKQRSEQTIESQVHD